MYAFHWKYTAGPRASHLGQFVAVASKVKIDHAEDLERSWLDDPKFGLEPKKTAKAK